MARDLPPSSPAPAATPACDPTALLDRGAHQAAARLTGGVSLLGLAEAWRDWGLHLATSPGAQLRLAEAAALLGAQTLLAPATPDTRSDPRFRAAAWSDWPFCTYAAGFQAVEQWWRFATGEVRGVTDQHRNLTAFAARQALDVVSPSNFALTNPEVLQATARTGGLNLVQGAANAAGDLLDNLRGEPSGGDAVGREVALTPGEVVARTPLAEIIQYRPLTGEVRPEPVVIVPAPIMKYYILDLTPADSLVRALVARGFTVFMVSWKNPGAPERDCGFDDYHRLGPLAAIEAACRITGSPTVHGVGYCMGGTLMTMTAAAMARDRDTRLASLSLLAAQSDFTEAGELRVFINESQVALLEDLMRDRGYLRPEQMSGAFQVLRANDLIWSRMIHGYLMGEPRRRTPLDAWSEDATRLPFALESENLRALYMNNDLAEGRFLVDGRPVALRDIGVDVFALGTETDHIAPWRSVYKLLLHADTDITFALTNHGHNVGVVCPPGSPGRHYRLRRQAALAQYADPDVWFAGAEAVEGSWWTPWFDWLEAHSGAPVPPPAMGPSLAAAPGDYVRER